MIHTNIENRYDKRQSIFHTAAFAIAAGVVGVGAAAAQTAIGMSAANRAKKAQGAAAGQFTKQQRSALQDYIAGQQEVGKAIEAVPTPKYDIGSMISDAERISAYNRAEIEKFQPGATALRGKSADQLSQAMDVINTYLKGEIPQDVKDQIIRNVAESAGAGFSPTTAGRAGGFQAAQGVMARQLGLTSLDLQGKGMAAIPSIQGVAQNWQQLSRAFISEPLDVGRVQLGFQTAAAVTGLQKAKLTSDMYQGIYGAQTGVNQQIYGANKENIAASYAAQQALGQGIGSMGQAASGALSGIGSAYSQYNTAMNASTTPLKSGFYAGEIGAANAYGVAPSQLSYQQPSGGFLGIGGQGGGYYYTPGGTFGRK